MHSVRGIMNDVRWAFDIAAWKPMAQEWIFANACIAPEEKKRVHQFMFKNDAMLALAGRLLIRSCVHKLLGIPSGDIQLSRTQKSKPLLMNSNDGLSFNVSHQGNYAVIAGSTLNEVGVDVMKIDRPVNTTIPDFFKTMRRQFTLEEWTVIKSKATEWDQMAAFYRFWCLKESYVKAIGTGLGTSTAEYMRFELNTESLSTNEVVVDSVLFVHGTKVNWTFHECLLDIEHIATVAVKPRDGIRDSLKPAPFVNLTFEELTKNVVPIGNEDPDDWQKFSSKKLKPVRNFSNTNI